MMQSVPEVLAPAGSLEKLKVAILYGADAVYLGGQKFGLRSAADNFTLDELTEGVTFAHQRGSKVYVVLNSFLHDQDLEELPSFVETLDELQVDAVIVSDLGVIRTVQNHSSIPVHLSTQASCLNVHAAKVWKQMGVERVVLGREVSLQEAVEVKKATGLELEMFVHGSMCMAYSGNCVISNYTQGRDSNRGGCAHSCRFQYELDFSSMGLSEKEYEKRNAYFMSSKDLNGLRLLEEYIQAGIDSIKIEGRMKSHHYAGTISRVYSEALSFYQQYGHFYSEKMQEWEQELRKVSHRDYTQASLVSPAGEDSIYAEREEEIRDYQVVGVVQEAVEKKHLVIEVRSAFHPHDELELIPFQGPAKVFTVTELKRLNGSPVTKTKPGTLVKIPYQGAGEKWNLVRAKVQRPGPLKQESKTVGETHVQL